MARPTGAGRLRLGLLRAWPVSAERTGGGAGRGDPAAKAPGADAARGEMLAFLDADDVWAPDKLRIQVGALERDPSLDAVFGLVEQFVTPDSGASVSHEVPAQ